MSLNSLNYRKEIDGLRALAILPVLIYHSGVVSLPGGFLGVDVFFIISGYLLTSIIINEKSRGVFTYTSFYMRRVRRILPTLYIVALCCIPLSFYIHTSIEFKDFSQSLIALNLFSTNVLFWLESGYFDTGSDLKPLLHTWSLGIEEQFYIVMPLLLFFYVKSPFYTFLTILILTLLSVWLAEFQTSLDPSTSFYLLPFRFFELALGSLTAIITLKFTIKRNHIFSSLGILTLIFSYVFLSKDNHLPGLLTLIPLTGAVLVLLFFQPRGALNRLLISGVMIHIGLLSYSLYLWHQPIFAALNILFHHNVKTNFVILGILLTYTFSIFTFNCVERPFRNKDLISSKLLISFITAGALITLFVGAVGHYHNGFARITTPKYKTNNNLPVYLLGDSHAEHLAPGLTAVGAHKVIDLSRPGCLPFRNVDRANRVSDMGKCADHTNAAISKLITVDHPSIVILSFMGPVYLDGMPFMGKDPKRVKNLIIRDLLELKTTDHYEIFRNGLTRTLTHLSNNPNLQIIVALDVPELGIEKGCGGAPKDFSLLGWGFVDGLAKVNISPEFCYVPFEAYSERTTRYKELISQVTIPFKDIRVFDPSLFLCNESKCKGYSDHYGYLYYDVDHLSHEGSRYFAENFYKWF